MPPKNHVSGDDLSEDWWEKDITADNDDEFEEHPAVASPEAVASPDVASGQLSPYLFIDLAYIYIP